MIQPNKILIALRSPNAVLAVLILALVAQMPHAADVFRLIVRGDDWAARLHSYSFAIALELAVLLFVVQNRHAESYGFAVASIAMNLSYYYLHNVQLVTVAALPALLVSVALPVAIARYSHAVVDAQDPMHAPPTTNTEEVIAIVQPTVQVAQVIVQPTVQPEPAQVEPNDKRERALQLHSEGLTNAQIASELNVHRNTVGAWLRAVKVAA